MTEPLYLEDIQVGRTFVSAKHELDAEQIKRFASEFDPQFFHTDEEAAKDSFFKGLAASGWHVAAVTMRLVVDMIPAGGGMIGASVEITWPQPTRPGDVLQVFSEVTEVRPSRSKPDRGIVTLRSETRNQKGEVLQVLTTKQLMFRRPA
ncbi:MaoC family dehydratase [Oricola thermophila]|uniref:MaoC family dehydratase n=1 Tax=Oricola thermophila TaxID=2742145 RepID=A0A6N1VFU2_9HYPH|nr:MaoC family dehydratase [Oricola thermophila]QKV19714.1 MaoC family dehydratase [Oricola thermophila]